MTRCLRTFGRWGSSCALPEGHSGPHSKIAIEERLAQCPDCHTFFWPKDGHKCLGATGEASPEMRDLVDNAIFGNATAEYTRPPLLAAIAALESQLAALTGDFNSALRNVAALTKERDELTKKYGNMIGHPDSAVYSLRSENAELERDKDELTAELAALRAENDSLKMDAERWRELRKFIEANEGKQ